MIKYALVIYWSEADQAFVVEVPDLPGCMADGATYAEALANVQTVIDLWLETAARLGRPIPSATFIPSARIASDRLPSDRLRATE